MANTKVKGVKLTITTTDGAVLREEILTPRDFSKGTDGFGTYGKIEDVKGLPADERYQLSFNMVRIGSGPAKTGKNK